MTIITGNNIDFETLKELQQQMKWEEANDNDYQASPRFWVIRDYRQVPANEDYTTGSMSYFHNDGDLVEFNTVEDLKSFLEEQYEDVDISEYKELQELMELLNDASADFDTLWDYVVENLNECGFFNSCWMAEESFIREDTMFLTKKEAQRHLELNHYHYSSKAHTYAMTAWRSSQVRAVVDFLMNFDFNQIKPTEQD